MKKIICNPGKTLNPFLDLIYRQMVAGFRISNFDWYTLLMEGRTDYEFRTTTVAELHDGDSFRKIGEWIRGARRYYLQKFTDRETVPFEGFHAPTDEEMRRYLEIARAYVPAAELRGV